MVKNNDAVMISRYIYEFLHDYAPKFLTDSKHTLKSYRDALSLYLAFLESEGITPSDFTRGCFERPKIEKWIYWLKEFRNCSSNTCNVRLASLRVFLEFIGSRDISLIYLSQEAKLIKKQKSIKRKANGLTRDAVTTMLATADTSTVTGKRDLVFMILLYATAARISEILSIKIKHVYVSGKKDPYLTIIGKSKKTRTLQLLPKAVAHIQKYISEVHGVSPDPEAYLFYSRVGGLYTKLTPVAINKRLKAYAAIAHEKCPDVPLNIHAHQFRHAKASHWLEDGINIVQISFLLGHANLQTTMVYLDISTEAKAKALGTLESENERKVDKNWKSQSQTLSSFCGLKK